MKLIVDGITKIYKSKQGIRNISFIIESGQCLALVGHNGAGKTTLLRVLSTLLKPDSGNILYNNYNVLQRDNVDYLTKIGYMPEDADLYKKLTVYKNLSFFWSFYDNYEKEKILHYLNLFSLPPNKKYGQLSKGQKQKLVFLKSVLHNPEILLLDEPFNFLDPSGRIMTKEILSKMMAEGKIIIISSHNLSELEGICNRMIILKNGHIAFDSIKTNSIINFESIYKQVMEK